MERKVLRNNYIDFIRGGGVILQVILIHTVFHSGYSYLPDIFRQISLFIDVPVFFVLTGMTYHLTGKLNPIRQFVKISLVFSIYVILYQIIFWDFSPSRLINSIFLNGADTPLLPSVNGSYWFIPVYVSSIIISFIIYKYFEWAKFPFLIASAIYYLLIFSGKTSFDCRVFIASLRACLFYTSLIILGAELCKCNPQKLVFMLMLVITIIVVFNFYKYNLQENKGPVNLPYILCALPSCLLVLFFNKKFSNLNVFLINFIGRNSIFFYLTQGIGASVLFYVLPYLSILNIFFKFIICFSLNIIISISLGIIYCKSFNHVGSLIKKYINIYHL